MRVLLLHRTFRKEASCWRTVGVFVRTVVSVVKSSPSEARFSTSFHLQCVPPTKRKQTSRLAHQSPRFLVV
jgi:hypothetical protein